MSRRVNIILFDVFVLVYPEGLFRRDSAVLMIYCLDLVYVFLTHQVKVCKGHLSNQPTYLLVYQCNKPPWNGGRRLEKLVNHEGLSTV